MLPEKHKSAFISVINWLLQDNNVLNQLTSDKNYMIDKFISIIIEFTELFRTFSNTINDSDLKIGIDDSCVFDFFKRAENTKKDIINTLDNSTSDLFDFLIRHSFAQINDKKSIVKKDSE